MTDIGVGAFMKLWGQSDQTSERKMQKFLLAGLDEREQRESDILSKIKVGKPTFNPVVRWMEEEGYPTSVTAQLTGAGTVFTLSGNLFGAAVTQETVQRCCRVGTIFERPTDGVQVKVSSISGITDGSAPWAATVAVYGNTSGADDAGPVEWEIIGEAWSDYKDAEGPRNLDRKFREVGTQIFAETFDIPKTRKNTKYEIVVDEVSHQIDKLLGKLRRQEAYAAVRGRPYYSAGYKWGNATEEPTMLGIQVWPEIVQSELANTNVYVNKSSTALYKTDLDALVYHMKYDEYANYSEGDWWIVCHPLVARAIYKMDSSMRETTRTDKGVGFIVQEFLSQEGKSFPIMTDRYLRQGTLMLCNFSKMHRGYYNQDQMDRKSVPTSGRYERWLISFQGYGIVVRDPRANIGMIYGIATS